jgi:hypothetical protein
MVPDDSGKERQAPQGEANGVFSRFREFTTDALRYWELRRLFYNLLLGVILLGHFIARWPASKSAVSFDAILMLFLQAVLANVAYSVVYLADVFIQLSGFRESRRVWRWVILLVGFTFAAIVAHFMSQGMVGGPNRP